MFEVNGDDAEEVKTHQEHPLAINISLFLVLVIYTLVVTVVMGPPKLLAPKPPSRIPSELSRCPGATMIACWYRGFLTRQFLHAFRHRESFTLSRGRWPTFLATKPGTRAYFAIIVIGAVSMFITLIGAVDFLSYITSGGYLFVLFLSNLSMITLRKKYPFIHRPFKVPFFPLTPIVVRSFV